MNPKLIDIIVGARPNFVKVAPVLKELNRYLATYHSNIEIRFINTNQHYDKLMSDIFFEELEIPKPNIIFSNKEENKSNSLFILFEYIDLLKQRKPDMAVVFGDVNSTLLCSIAVKIFDSKIILAHIEAGLRCEDTTMPEEMNRRLTDSITDYFFTTSITASNHLKREGVAEDRIFFVGNTMIDTLFQNIRKLKAPFFWEQLGLRSKSYYLLTLHRQGNICNKEKISKLLKNIVNESKGLPIVFPIHPHTQKMLQLFKIKLPKRIKVVEPLGYLEFNYLLNNAFAVITDSGGISEEATILNVPCMTLRDNTERPETCTQGTNLLIGNDAKKINQAFTILKNGDWAVGRSPQLWDGQAANRIIPLLVGLLSNPLSSCLNNKSKVIKKIYNDIILN